MSEPMNMDRRMAEAPDRAFEGTSIKNFSLPRGIEQIGTAAFRTGKENGVSRAVVYLPGAGQEQDRQSTAGQRLEEAGDCGLPDELQERLYWLYGDRL